ncbi:hypothetical protein ACRS6B_25075 [Nocardia asteroides]
MVRTLRNPRNRRFHWDSWRRISTPTDQGVRLAATTQNAFDYHPANLRRWREELGGVIPDTTFEQLRGVFAKEISRTPAVAAAPELELSAHQ